MAFWRNAPRNLWRNHTRRLLPHVGPPLGLATVQALVGLLVLAPVLRRIELGTHGDWLAQLLHLIDAASVAVLPQLVVGIGLEIMAFGLLLRARVAWNLSLLLLAAAVVLSRVGLDRSDALLACALGLAAALVYCWRRFDRASIAAASLFALLSIGSLLIYAVLGTLYLGHDFSPPIEDLSTAFYFSIVSMSTVGYGDITPHTAGARLFTASIIVFGITVFATSISAVVGPMIGGSLKRIVKGGISNVTRNDHFLIVGASPIAHSVYAGLRKRGYAVAVLVPANVGHSYPEEADLIAGDASDAATLKAAGAATARAVLALRADDAENAFTVLAIRDLAPQVRTVALVNDPRNLHRLRLLKPDMVFSPQQLAGELLARTLNEETIDNALVSQLLFGTGAEEVA
jgi:voltage-gated potassium channel